MKNQNAVLSLQDADSPNPAQRQATHSPEIRDIPGFPGYQATSDGEILTNSHWRGLGRRALNKQIEKDGYLYVRLQKNGKRLVRRVHALVCLAFHGPYTVGQETRHLNGDRKDNRAENLRWGTRQENATDRLKHGNAPRGEAHSQSIKAGIWQSNGNKSQHSPLPWRVYARDEKHFDVNSSDNETVAETHVWYDGSGRKKQFPDGVILSGETAKANAYFIVRACNNAERLAEALKMACKVIEGENLDEAMAGEYEILTDALEAWEGSAQ
jgi:hypothetical protein